jgi:DNA invertase Pin-like site-specific DNA recombinase
MATKRVISYGRVSTEEQGLNSDKTEKKDASPEAQKQRCISKIKDLESKTGSKYTHLKHISDIAYSGKNTNRPGFQEIWSLVGAGKIDIIISTELSRLSRSVLDFLQLVQHCEKNKVDIVIIGLDLDSSSPFGRVMIIILVALAQFEREMTASRVKENALIHLLNKGKINGAAEILGLDRDTKPQNKGHFLVNPEELLKVEKILRLFVKVSSKKKVLAMAKDMGLTGKKGRELSEHMLDIMLENTKWRYRGLWYANKENKGTDQTNLPESKKYQIVKLPHGPLIDLQLLDDVSAKIEDTYSKRKKSGKNDYTYLLTNLLIHEDGSKFASQPAKNLKYRYYYSPTHKLRIHCDELHKVVIEKTKKTMIDDDDFKKMLEAAVSKRNTELPKLYDQIKQKEKAMAELEVTNTELRAQLRNPDLFSKPELFGWLEGEVKKMGTERQNLQLELETLRRCAEETKDAAGLSDLRKTAIDYVRRFDQLTGTEQRNILEKIVDRVTVMPGNRIEIRFHGQPQKQKTRLVAGWKKSSEYEEIGVTDGA